MLFRSLRRLGLEPVVCDVTDSAGLKAAAGALPDLDAVCHCVALDRTSGQSMQQVYVQGLHNVLDAWRISRVRRIVYVSSTSVYGQTGGEEVDESAVTQPQEESGRIVLEAERMLTVLPNAVVLRVAGIYGPGRLLRRRTIVPGAPIVADPEKWLNLIHVEDGAAAVLAAAERGAPGQVYNVADGSPVQRRDFYTLQARLLNAPEPRFVLPALDAPLPPHERANRRIVNRKMREELGVELSYPSYEKGLAASV